MTKGGPQGHAGAETRRKAPARADYHSYLAAEDTGKGTTGRPHFTRQLVSVGTLTSSVKRFDITVHRGPECEVAWTAQHLASASAMAGNAPPRAYIKVLAHPPQRTVVVATHPPCAETARRQVDPRSAWGRRRRAGAMSGGSWRGEASLLERS